MCTTVAADIKQLGIYHQEWLVALGREREAKIDNYAKAQEASAQARKKYTRLLSTVFSRELCYPNEIH